MGRPVRLRCPDGAIVNVTKDAIWVRDAALPKSTSARRPSTTTELKQLLGGVIPKTLRVPESKYQLDELVDEATWANEIDKGAFTPPGLQRDLVRKFPAELAGMEVPLFAMFTCLRTNFRIKYLARNPLHDAEQLQRVVAPDTRRTLKPHPTSIQIVCQPRQRQSWRAG